MSIIYYRNDDDDTDVDLELRSKAIGVSDKYPLPVRPLKGEDDDPFEVKVGGTSIPPVQGQTITSIYPIPGIGTGSAYADGEAFGTTFSLSNVFGGKSSGTIVGMFLLDLDDEAIQVDVPIFTQPIAGTTDNNAFAPTDAELLNCRAVFPISEFYNWSSNSFGQYAGTPKWISLDGPNAYSQAVVRGAANVAAGNLPKLGVVTIPD